MAGERLVFHLDMDAFYASVEQLERPELRGLPVIVGYNGPRGVVAAASYEARQFGIRSAMAAATAHRLCPQASWVPLDFVRYRRYSGIAFDVMSRHTPLIEPLSLDEAYLDLGANRAARSDPEAYGRQLKAEVREATSGLTASVGIGACKVVAKVASDFRKPDGLTLVAAGEEAAFLAPLPLRALPGLGPAAEKRLAGLGLRSIGDLARLPQEVLRARLGNQGEGLAALARGIDPRPVMVPGQARSISREVTFERDQGDFDALRQVARELADDVARSLRRQRLLARTIRLKLRFSDFETHSRQATLEVATDITVEIQARAEALLAGAIPAGRVVRLLGVTAASLTESAQASLLEVGGQARERTLDATIDGLRDRFGPSALVRGGSTSREQRDYRRDDLDSLIPGDE
ncbi:MAG: DNA polymerase IV [Candidatus Dormibacteria bacterium]